jgi:hypothetical protein
VSFETHNGFELVSPLNVISNIGTLIMSIKYEFHTYQYIHTCSLSLSLSFSIYIYIYIYI